MNRSELLALVDSTLVGPLYIVRLLSVTWWICLNAVVCANPDVVQTLIQVWKSFQIVSFRAPVFAEATARQGNQLRFGAVCAGKKP